MPYIVGIKPTTQTLELTGASVRSAISTTTSTDQFTLVSISKETYRSVSYQVQVVQGTNYNTTNISVIHDGSVTYMNEYGTLIQPIGVATFSTDISGSSLRLLGYPSSSTDTTFKVVYTAIKS